MTKFKLNNKYNIIFIFVIGVFTSFSLPPYNNLFINFITIPFFFILILKNINSSKWKIFYLGWGFGFGYFCSNLYWIINSLTFDPQFKILIPIAFIVIPLFLGIFYGLVSFVFSYFKNNNEIILIFIFAVIFSLVDFLRGFIFGGFPWNIIAFSWTKYLSSIQILSYIGTYTFNLFSITLFLIPSIAFLKIKNLFKAASLLITFLILLSNYIYGNSVLQKSKNTVNNLDFKIKIASPKISIMRFLQESDPEKTIKDLILISKPKLNERTIFIYPEGILPGVSLQNIQNYKDIISNHFSKNHIIVMGINSYKNQNEFDEIYNSLAVFDNKLNVLFKYDKNNLVPFGEFLPFENFFSKFGLKKITQGYQSFSSGSKREVINIFNKNFLPLICYEIIYSGSLKKKSEDFDFILNLSEDGWFGDSIGLDQHFSHSIFRAIEEGKYLIRSANNGSSAYINFNGEVLESIKSTESGVIEVNYYEKPSETLFSSQGNKIFFYFIAFYIILIFFFKKKGSLK